jgi:hypothetical protein
MWQRKQTLFLALALILAALLHLLPLASFERIGSTGTNTLTLYGVLNPDGQKLAPAPSIPLPWVNALLIVQLVIAIALFKNRLRQLRFTRLGFLFALGMIAAVVFTHTSVASAMGTAASVNSTLLPAAYIPFVLPVLIWLAERGIKHDEELVKSADRLR